MPFRLLFLIISLGSLQSTALSESLESQEIPLFLSPLDGDPPQKGGSVVQDDNHEHFTNVENEYLGVESINTHPPNATFSIDNAIEDDESNSIDGEPLTFSDFISFPTKDFMKELQRMKAEFGESLEEDENLRIVPFIVKEKALNGSMSERRKIIIKPRPFYPSWPIQEDPTSYEKNRKAIRISGEPRSSSQSDFNAILFTKTRSPIVIVEAPNLAVIGKTAPKYKTRMPFRVLKSSSKARKKPRKRFRYIKARLPKRRKPFFNRDVVAFPSFFGKQRRVRQFYFHPNSAFYG